MGKELVMSEQLREATDKLVAVIGYNPVAPIFAKANVVLAVRDWLEVPEVRSKLMALQGTEAGYLTDMDEKGGYDEKTVRNCVTVALTNGFQLVGNEFNIIAGKFYGAKAGYKRKCREFENDRFKVLHVGDPDNGDVIESPTTVTVPMQVTYVLLDKETQQRITKTLKKRIQLTKKSRDMVDAWLGKAAKRLYQRLLSDLTGQEFDFDEHGGDGVIKEDKPEVGRQDLGTRRPEAEDAQFSPAGESPATPPADAQAPAAAEGEGQGPGEPGEAPAALGRGRRPPARNERF